MATHFFKITNPATPDNKKHINAKKPTYKYLLLISIGFLSDINWVYPGRQPILWDSLGWSLSATESALTYCPGIWA